MSTMMPRAPGGNSRPDIMAGAKARHQKRTGSEPAPFPSPGGSHGSSQSPLSGASSPHNLAHLYIFFHQGLCLLALCPTSCPQTGKQRLEAFPGDLGLRDGPWAGWADALLIFFFSKCRFLKYNFRSLFSYYAMLKREKKIDFFKITINPLPAKPPLIF